MLRPLPRSLTRWLIVLAGLLPVSIQAQVPEAQLKAAFIYNFALFTRWPQSPDATDLKFCIEENGELTPAVRALAGKPVGSLTVAVQIVPVGREVPEQCGVWIVGAAASAPPVEHRGTLVISDGGSIDGHVMIALVVDDAHVRFDIDTVAAQKAGLTFSSKLLRLARRTR